MPILFIDIFRALWALRRDTGFVALGILLLFAVSGGGVFYYQVEDLRPLNAVYLSVITLTTVGYGDPAPATAAGKIFTMAFLFVGMGLVVAFISTIAAHIRRHSVLHGPVAKLAAHHDARRSRKNAQPARAGELRPVAGLSAIGEYDLLVIGSDEASRQTAVEAAQAGLRVVMVEPGHVLHEADGGPGADGGATAPAAYTLIASSSSVRCRTSSA